MDQRSECRGEGGGVCRNQRGEELNTAKYRTTMEMGVGLSYLERDSDPDTLDYTLRADVERVGPPGLPQEAAGECEGKNMGVDLQIMTVEEDEIYFSMEFGGESCAQGEYEVQMTVRDAESKEVVSITFTQEVA